MSSKILDSIKNNITITTDHTVTKLKIENNVIKYAIVKDNNDNYTIINAKKFILCNGNCNTLIKHTVFPIIPICGYSWSITTPNSLYNLYKLTKISTILDGNNNIFYSDFKYYTRITYGYFLNPISKKNLINNWVKYSDLTNS